MHRSCDDGICRSCRDAFALSLRYFTGQKVPGDRALVYLVTATSPTPRTLKFSKFTKSICKLFYQYFTYYELPHQQIRTQAQVTMNLECSLELSITLI